MYTTSQIKYADIMDLIPNLATRTIRDGDIDTLRPLWYQFSPMIHAIHGHISV